MVEAITLTNTQLTGQEKRYDQQVRMLATLTVARGLGFGHQKRDSIVHGTLPMR
jgi:hypothetical protein